MHDRHAPVLVLLHGLLSTPQEFALLQQHWRHHDLDVIVPHIPAYSKHPGREPNAWRDWVESAAYVIDDLVPHDRPVVLGGLCIGGVLAAALTLQSTQRFAGLAMLSPTFTYDGWGLPPWTRWRFLGYALGLSRWIRVAERPPYGIKNSRIRARIAEQMTADGISSVGPCSLPLWAIREGERMMAWVESRLTRLRVPTLVLHAREDEICRLSSVESLMGRIGSRHKHLVVLDDSYHMITIDNDRAQVAQELAQFCKAIFELLPASARCSPDHHRRLEWAKAG